MGSTKVPGLLHDEAKTPIQTGSFESEYEILESIARGRYAEVKKCQRKSTGKRYAAKFIRKGRSSVKGNTTKIDALHEIAVLERTHENPRFVTLYEAFETPKNYVLILELAVGGELENYCEESLLTEYHMVRILKQLLEAIVYLHDMNVAHMDIKPSNILLTHSDPEISDIKLCDFGISRKMSSELTVQAMVGTPEYVSPEVLNYDPLSEVVDVWSIGVLTYVLATGISPFAGDNDLETYNNITTNSSLDLFDCETFEDVSSGAVDFIKSCLVRNYRRRPSARECLNHSWIQGCPNSDALVIEKQSLGESTNQEAEKRSENSEQDNMERITPPHDDDDETRSEESEISSSCVSTLSETSGCGDKTPTIDGSTNFTKAQSPVSQNAFQANRVSQTNALPPVSAKVSKQGTPAWLVKSKIPKPTATAYGARSERNSLGSICSPFRNSFLSSIPKAGSKGFAMNRRPSDPIVRAQASESTSIDVTDTGVFNTTILPKRRSNTNVNNFVALFEHRSSSSCGAASHAADLRTGSRRASQVPLVHKHMQQHHPRSCSTPAVNPAIRKFYSNNQKTTDVPSLPCSNSGANDDAAVPQSLSPTSTISNKKCKVRSRSSSDEESDEIELNINDYKANNNKLENNDSISEDSGRNSTGSVWVSTASINMSSCTPSPQPTLVE